MQICSIGSFQNIRQNTIQFKATSDWPRNLLKQIATKLLIRFLNGTRISEALFRFLSCHKRVDRLEKFCGVEAAFSAFSVSRLASTFRQKSLHNIINMFNALRAKRDYPRLKYPLRGQRFNLEQIFRPNVTSYIKLVHAFHISIRELLWSQPFSWNQ